MAYHQITREERYTIWALRRHEKSMAEIARTLGRHRSTIHREVRRNCGRADGFYRPLQAHGYARTRRSHSRRNFRLTAQDWHMVEVLLMKEDWSPEQIAGRLDLEGRLQICHETIYRHVWNDKRHGGLLHTHLRQATKKRRKRHGTYDSRGRLAGKRPIARRRRECGVCPEESAAPYRGCGGLDALSALLFRRAWSGICGVEPNLGPAGKKLRVWLALPLESTLLPLWRRLLRSRRERTWEAVRC